METKAAIRKRILSLRKEMPYEEQCEKSMLIQQKIFKHEEFLKADTIYLYMACKGEVQMDWLLEQCFLLGKKVVVPKVLQKQLSESKTLGDDVKQNKTDSIMEFYRIFCKEDLQPGYFGILEPVTEEVIDSGQGFMAVPGVAFSRDGMRIGYGKGFYDRYLTRFPDIYTCGAAYEMQVVDRIPAEQCDVRLMDLITEGV